MPDILYIVRPGDDNDELRYSLRSLTNLPHGRVWIAGHKPAWLTNVEHIPTTQPGSKHENATLNLRAALTHPDIPARLVLFNDDFFVMQPTAEMPVLHAGPLKAFCTAYAMAHMPNAHSTAMRDSIDMLARLGLDRPLTYSIHYPMPIDTAGMLDTLDRINAERKHIGARAHRLHRRSIYGNLHNIGGQYVASDCKVSDREPRDYTDQPFLSTNDASFRTGPVGEHMRAVFPDPSPYET